MSVVELAEALAKAVLEEGLDGLDIEFNDMQVIVLKKQKPFVVFGDWSLEYENDPVGQEG